ncbi:MAG: hypothetical protein WC979_07830 [Candidatus Pacearchaeota archaeon]|jgi:hypothetical protein
MTIHCITSFRGPNEEYGYVLGSDSRAENDLGEVFNAQKHFIGKTFLGLIRGNVPRLRGMPDDYNFALRSLDEMFEGISQGIDYSHLPVLQQSSDYCLFVAKREDSCVNLFTVSTLKKRRHRAKEIGKMDPLVQKSTVYLALNSPDYLEFSSDLYDYNQALKTANAFSSPPIDFLNLFAPSYEPGPVNLYVVSSKRIGKIS